MRLIVIGCGPLLHVISEYAKLNNVDKKWDTIVSICLSEDLENISKNNNLENIDSVETYYPTDNDVFICSYPDIYKREKSIQIIKDRGGKFVNIIHPLANISSSVSLGHGVVIGAFTTVSVNVKIADHVMIQDHCNIGHDCTIGTYTHLFVGCTVSGCNIISDKVTLYTRSLIFPNIRIGGSSIVGAASVVMRKVKAGETVMGNPAKKIENI